MKARLHYNLPEDNCEFLAASRSMEILEALRNIDNLCRTQVKHGATKTAYELAEDIRRHAWEELTYHEK